MPDGRSDTAPGDPETLMALRPEDVRAYYDATIRPDLTTIVIVGDVTPEQASRVVDATFGGWQANGTTPLIDLPPVRPSPSSGARVADVSAVQDRVILAETMSVPVASPDRIRFAARQRHPGKRLFVAPVSGSACSVGVCIFRGQPDGLVALARRLQRIVRGGPGECGEGPRI